MSDFPLRNDTYQTSKNVAVTIYKGTNDVELVDVYAEETGVAVKLKVNGEECMKSWEFFKNIKPGTKKVDNGSKKIEIIFEKVESGNWKYVEAQQPSTVPLYQKWSQVEFPEEEEKKDRDFGEFIQELYKNATPEQKRAMEKSIYESHHTVLSCDWNDVGSRYVEPVEHKDNK